MKKILFYTLLICQSLFICLFPFQYQLIDKYGEEFRLMVSQDEYKDDYYYSEYNELRLEIETIPKAKWEAPKPDYQEKVYVVLKKDDQEIYQLERAVANKPIANENEIILPAKFSYEMDGLYFVDYGKVFRLGAWQDMKESLNLEEPIFALYQVAPWQQYKMKNVTN